jgi:transposase
LPREIVRHELPEAERVCAHDGHSLAEVGAEVSEQMDVIPKQARVLQHHRVKHAWPCCDQSLKVAPTRARIIPRGLLTEQAQAWITTGQYQFGTPLYRTAALLRRFGGDLVSNTLVCGVVRIGRAVQPVINLLRDHLLDSDLIYGDETMVQVLKELGRKAQTKSFKWAQMNGTGPPVRLFAYAPCTPRDCMPATTLNTSSLAGWRYHLCLPRRPHQCSFLCNCSVPSRQTDIRVEIQRAGVSVSVTWPVSAAAECAI